MELSGLIIIAIALVYLTKNSRGKQVLDNFGDAAVEISAAAKSASTALHKQCDELLQPDTPEEKAQLKAKLAKKTEDDADYSDIL